MNLIGYRTSVMWDCKQGLAYDYVTAGNGVWVEAQNPHIHAMAPVAAGEIRGLPSLLPYLEMKHGRIPQYFFDLAMSVMLGDRSVERYAAIAWEGGYHIVYPPQQGKAGAVEYENPPSVVFEMHSHPGGFSEFSSKDDTDEQGFRIFAVVSHLGRTPRISLRLGVYGYFQPVKWSDVFEGTLSGAVEGEEEIL